MGKGHFFWGVLLAVSIAFIAFFAYFFLAVIYPYHVEQMKARAVETVSHMQLVMPHLDAAARQSYLEKISQKTEELSYLLLMDVQGVALAHSNPKRVGMRFDEPGIRRCLATGERVEQIFMRDADNPSSPYHGEKTIDMIEPLHLDDGTVVGAVNVGVSLAKVERIKRKYLQVLLVVSFAWLIFILAFALSQLRTMAQKKKADIALRESERRLSHAITATSDTIWEYGLPDRGLIYNVRWHEMLGCAELEGPLPLEYWQGLCHPDDIDRVSATIQAALSQHDKVRYEVEFRMRHTAGHWQWMLGRGNVVEFDAGGQALSLSGTIVDINERKLQEERLRESEVRYRGIINNMQDGYYRGDREGVLIFISPSLPQILGYDSPEEMLGRSIESFWAHPEERAAMIELIGRNGKVTDYEVQLLRKDGTVVCCATSSGYCRDQTGTIVGVEGIVRDISERKSMQGQLLHAQKMEALGRLAGGVAHDFNNMLSVILGRAELALLRLPPDNPLKESLVEIRDVAERSARLTQHLLAFARKQAIEPVVVELGEVVGGMLKMYQRLIREEIEFEWLPAATALWVKIDPSQLDQILTNLCVNARDAIAGTGKISLAIGRVSLNAVSCFGCNELIPGEYATLSVSDTGCGMDEEMLDHIFEPFFTTKGVGAGTGLGLATVFGIVQQNNGKVDVQSTPGEGTVFTLYLPLAKECAMDGEGCVVLDQLVGHGETLLLVEDDATILAVATLMLEELHYHVLAADDPEAAIQLAANYSGTIHLLFTDMVMPKMNGQELATHIRVLYPQIKCLFMSGYTADVVNLQGILDKDMQFIQKPLSMQVLARKVNKILSEVEPV